MTYIEAQKRKLVEYIRFLDDQAAAHTEDTGGGGSSSSSTTRPAMGSYLSSLGGGFPPSPARPREVSSASTPALVPENPLPRNFSDEGFEAVQPEDIPSVVASGVRAAEEATRRGWFGWGAGTRSVSAPVIPASQSPSSES